MALYKRTPFTIGPGWEPRPDPQETEALNRASFQARVNANEQARADAKRSEQLQAWQRLLQQEEAQKIRAEDHALDERDWQRKLEYEINPKNERDAIELASSLAYRSDKLGLDSDRNKMVAAQGSFSRREATAKREAAEKERLKNIEAATEEARIASREKVELAQLKDKEGAEKALHKYKIQKLQDDLKVALAGGKGDTAQIKAEDAERQNLFSAEGLGAEPEGTQTSLERVQEKLLDGIVPSHKEVSSVLSTYYNATHDKTKKIILESLRSSFRSFLIAKKQEIQNKEAEALKSVGFESGLFDPDDPQNFLSAGGLGDDASRAWKHFAPEFMGGDPKGRAFASPEIKRSFLAEKTKSLREQQKAELQAAIHLMEQFPGVVTTEDLISTGYLKGFPKGSTFR